MNTLNFPDSNVWLALLWERHIHSEKANEWFERESAAQFFFCRFTQLTLLRLLTTEAILGEDTLTMSAAWNLWDKTWTDTRISLLAEPVNLDPDFRFRSRLASASPKVWADAYLLAFASVAGLRFVTFDRALKAPGVEVLVL
ncbi:MAG TPA: TA system VapC family ribonuclease toxin [Terriglobales bacterium]